MKKRILIDGRFIGVGESMTRYCLEIVEGILGLDKESEYTLLIRPAGESVIQKSKIKDQNDNLKIKVLNIAHYSIGEQTELLNYLNKENFDLVHFIQFNHPIRYKGKFVVTIHDLTLFGHLHRQRLHKRIAFGMVMKSAVKNSAQIITVSETSKKDIVESYKVDPDKITVTHLAVESKYNLKLKSQKQKICEFKEKYGIAGDYILYTGMWKKHKNLVRMLKAYEKLIQKSKIKDQKDNLKLTNSEASCHCEEDVDLTATKQSCVTIPQLVLVGKIDKDEPEVVTLINDINRRISNIKCQISNEISNVQYSNTKELSPVTYHLKPIVCTGFVEEEELPIAYAGALFYVIPSLSEGFGLPPLEAMSCGTPVISSDISAMPEILGSAAIYFDPYNIDDIAEKMAEMASSQKLRDEYSQKGLEQVAKYNWQSTVRETFMVYKDSLSIE